jgi:hypothetical protein
MRVVHQDRRAALVQDGGDSQPSVKGIVLVSAVDRVRQLLDAGEIQVAEVADALEVDDLEYLKTPIVPTLWYPVGACGRYLELLWEIEGRSPGFPGERGAQAAERIFKEGVYADLMKTAKRWGPNQVATALINLAAQLYNFMRWELVGNYEDDEYAIDVRNASEWPDVLRLASEGFIEVLHSGASGRSLSVSSSRLAADRVIFRIAVTGPKRARWASGA